MKNYTLLQKLWGVTHSSCNWQCTSIQGVSQISSQTFRNDSGGLIETKGPLEFFSEN